MKNPKKRKGIVYSTNPEYEFGYVNEEIEEIEPHKQILNICIDKHRGGKTVVIIKNFVGSKEKLKNLAKLLKIKCGVGGSVKKGEIIIQGNIRDTVINILHQNGYLTKRVGG